MRSLICLLSSLALACGLKAAETPLAIDAKQSRVDVAVKATVDSFVGKLETYDAAIVIDTALDKIVRAKLSFHFKDVRTGNLDRDEAMHAWQATPTYPDGEFTLTSIDSDSAGLHARGTLTLHGHSKEIVFPVTLSHVGDRYSIDGDAALDTRDYGLPIVRKLMVLKVDPEVHVRFHLQGVAASASASPGVFQTNKLN